ncbi:MAG: DNA primase [Candidatus Hydrogenedentes bacterium]|nr:DNA primase [Candidatus Hydrogenedentota bacterium]
MPQYSRETVAEVLAANDIVDILGRSLELKRAGGGRFKALCPFHSEKTPSFTIDQNRQMFHCFGCGKGGDILAFVMEHEGLSFVEALQQLADRAAIRLPQPDAASTDKDDLRAQVLKFNDSASRFFQRNLAHPELGAIGRAYLETRKLRPETVTRFELGYAPDGYTHLHDAAQKKGHSTKVMEASGLLKRGERGSLYDIFRNRLIVPIKDVAGKTVAFGGRDLGDSPAKYINSPETVLYRKSRVLYALSEARDAMRKTGYALLMEGYFDVMRAFDAGIEHAVATCGTALTLEQAQLLKRYAPEVVLVYDGDNAGIQAALKGVSILVQAGLRVRVATLPNGQDPDDYIRDAGPQAFLEAVERAPGFVPFYVAASREKTETVEGKTAVANELFAIIAQMNDALRVDEYLKVVAGALKIHEWECKRAYGIALQHRPQAPRLVKEAETPEIKFTTQDCMFLAALVRTTSQHREYEEKLKHCSLPEGPVGEILALFREHGMRTDALLHSLSGESRQLWTAACVWPEEDLKNPEDLVCDWFGRMEQVAAHRQVKSIMNELQNTDAGLPEQEALLRKTLELRKEAQTRKQGHVWSALNKG